MGYVVTLFSRILIVLGMLIFFAGPLRADPVITFINGTDFEPTPINIRNIDQQFFVGLIGVDGTLKVGLVNQTDFTFQDFHFVTNVPQGAPLISLDGGQPFFSDFTSDKSRIDFVKGGAAEGLPGHLGFIVEFKGFAPNTQIRATATIPEPTTLLLLSTGLAGVVIKTRKRLKNRKSG